MLTAHVSHQLCVPAPRVFFRLRYAHSSCSKRAFIVIGFSSCTCARMCSSGTFRPGGMLHSFGWCIHSPHMCFELWKWFAVGYIMFSSTWVFAVYLKLSLNSGCLHAQQTITIARSFTPAIHACVALLRAQSLYTEMPQDNTYYISATHTTLFTMFSPDGSLNINHIT